MEPYQQYFFPKYVADCPHQYTNIQQAYLISLCAISLMQFFIELDIFTKSSQMFINKKNHDYIERILRYYIQHDIWFMLRTEQLGNWLKSPGEK